MDADLKAELDAAVDVMREQLDAARSRVLAAPHVLSDGICRIEAVSDRAFPPCVGYLWTDLGEKFPLFTRVTLEHAQTLIGRRVYLSIAVSPRGSRYVHGVEAMPVDMAAPLWPCPKCGNVALPDPLRAFYICRSCHYQMEAKP